MSDDAYFNSEDMEKDRRLWNFIILNGYSPKKFSGVLQDKIIKLKTEGTFPGGQIKMNSIIKKNFLKKTITLDKNFLSIDNQILTEKFSNHGIELIEIDGYDVMLNYWGSCNDFNTAIWESLIELKKKLLKF